MQHNNWKTELTQAVRDIAELRRLLELPESIGAVNDYPLLVPRSFLDRMEKGNPNDPLLLQVLPRQEEAAIVPGFSCDPLDEANVAPCRILKKYAGRALLLASDACGIHCRFCFRRFLPKSIVDNDFKKMLEPIQTDTTVSEIILSGGDPLMLDDSELEKLFYYISKISHVKRIRVHSRLPIVLPSRLTPELMEILSPPLPVYLVLHVNHPNELSDEFLQRRNMLMPVVLSQTVLLKGINDDADTLCQLFGRLINHRILPYYLHQLDRIQGAAHFEVLPETGHCLMEKLRNRLPGYAVPKYVREVPGLASKVRVS